MRYPQTWPNTYTHSSHIWCSIIEVRYLCKRTDGCGPDSLPIEGISPNALSNHIREEVPFFKRASSLSKRMQHARTELSIQNCLLTRGWGCDGFSDTMFSWNWQRWEIGYHLRIAQVSGAWQINSSRIWIARLLTRASPSFIYAPVHNLMPTQTSTTAAPPGTRATSSATQHTSSTWIFRRWSCPKQINWSRIFSHSRPR